MYNNAYNVYKNNSVTYASKDQLLLMLVDGAVKFSKIAREALKEGNVKKAHENLIKTQDIFSELMISLDTNSGEWAKNIFNIYAFIKESLVKANLKKDIEELEKIIPLIEEVRDLWYEVDKKSKK
ncbi:flagellar export chaperone FliS [uncultured Clostridium sp.]|uniref:flagellar export chaperone FliS n=1 Tax=uncultured Clostridium sp. TaxID=59620 RepID=UPI00258F52FE|nr:flagellar export chaperone FliS [uncultured Clostridium sp.]